MKLLVVEDERLLADSLVRLLQSRRFEVDAVYDGESGLCYAETGVYDLILLDVMLPGLDGYEVARRLRKQGIGTRILMLTARAELVDRVSGLESGADYYLTKPFDNRELLACVNALLRRSGEQVDRLTLGNTALELSTSRLLCGNNSLRLSAKEFEVMRLLLESGERNLSKETLLVKVWGYDSEAVDNNVEVYVGFLRKKLKKLGSDIRIEAVRRLGYHLEVSPS